MVFGSILFGFFLLNVGWNTSLSIIAANRLLAVLTACMSPVKCRFISSIGTTCEYPPPAAPPLIPNTGPMDGSRSVLITFLPILAKPWVNPIFITVLPSPKGVGVTAVISIYFPSGLSFNLSNTSSLIFALYLPYSSISSSVSPICFAISMIGFITAA